MDIVKTEIYFSKILEDVSFWIKLVLFHQIFVVLFPQICNNSWEDVNIYAWSLNRCFIRIHLAAFILRMLIDEETDEHNVKNDLCFKMPN